jgi:hypothetical protein
VWERQRESGQYLDQEHGAHGVHDDEVKALGVVRVGIVFLDHCTSLHSADREHQVGSQGRGERVINFEILPSDTTDCEDTQTRVPSSCPSSTSSSGS